MLKNNTKKTKKQKRKNVVGLIYRAVNKANGKSYIGQTIYWPKRKQQHIRAAFNENAHDYDYPFHRAIRKYGPDSFKWFILCDNIKSKDLDTAEIGSIAAYKPEYNPYPGGEGRPAGYKVSAETRKKNSLVAKKRFAKPENNPMYKHNHTKKTKKLISEAAKSRGISGENNPMFGKKRPDLSLRNKLNNPMKDLKSKTKMAESQKKRIKRDRNKMIQAWKKGGETRRGVKRGPYKKKGDSKNVL